MLRVIDLFLSFAKMKDLRGHPLMMFIQRGRVRLRCG